jgi:prepilin-type N-terminal cleavage/methylation domain-containing protein
MARIAISNKKGSTLIELMVAMGILAIVAVALMQSSIIVLQTSVQNEIRDESVRLAEQRMNELRSGPGGFDNADPSGLNLDLVGNFTYPPVTRTIRNAPVQFTLSKSIVSLEPNTKQVTVTVAWQFRNKQYNHSVMSIVRRYGL